MTCVWDGIIKLLTLEEINSVFDLHLSHKPSPSQFVKYIKIYNRKTPHVKHNGIYPTPTQLIENMERINNIDNINNGYDFSGFDPILFLISELFRVKIIHIYNKKCIHYKRKKSKHILKFESNTHHFWALERN